MATNWNINLKVPENCKLIGYSTLYPEIIYRTWNAGETAVITSDVQSAGIIAVRLYEYYPGTDTPICYHSIEYTIRFGTSIAFSLKFCAVDTTLDYYNNYFRQGLCGYNITECVFQNCTNLKVVSNLPGTLDTVGHRNTGYMFDGCTNLKYVDLSNIARIEYLDELFAHNSSIEEVILPTAFSSIDKTFYECTSLKTVSHISKEVISAAETFYGCTSLTGDIYLYLDRLPTEGNPFSDCFSHTVLPINIFVRTTDFIPYIDTGDQDNLNVVVAAMPSNQIHAKFNPIVKDNVISFLNLNGDGDEVVYGSKDGMLKFDAGSPRATYDGMVIKRVDITALSGKKYPSVQISYISNWNEDGSYDKVDVYSAIENRWLSEDHKDVYLRLMPLSTDEPGASPWYNFIDIMSKNNPEADIIPWTFNADDGSLIIGNYEESEEGDFTGTADISKHYITNSVPPWLVKREYIKSVEIRCNPELMNYWFYRCTRLETINAIPYSVRSLCGTFYECTSLDLPTLMIAGKIYNAYDTFYHCAALNADITLNTEILSNRTDIFEGTVKDIFLRGTEGGLHKLSASKVNVITVDGTYQNTYYYEIYNNTVSKFWVIDKTVEVCVVPEIPATIEGAPLTSLERTYYNCTNLKLVPNIPENINNLNETFYGCTSLGSINTTICILGNITSYNDTFKNTTLDNDIILIPKVDASNVNSIAAVAAGYSNVYYTAYPELTVQSMSRTGINTLTNSSDVLLIVKVEYTNFNDGNYITMPRVDLGTLTEDFNWFFDPLFTEPFESGARYTGPSSIMLYGINHNEGYRLDQTFTFDISIHDKYLSSVVKQISLSKYTPLLDFDALTGKEVALGCMASMNCADEPIGIFRCAMDMNFELLNNVSVVDTGETVRVTRPDESYMSDDYILAGTIVDTFGYSTAKEILGLNDIE